MKEIPLTQGKVALVDDEDYERLMAMGKWYVETIGYAAKNIPVMNGTVKKYTIQRMHRVISNAGEKDHVDHINGDRLDNRRCNLRLCTQAQNLGNQRTSKNNHLGVKGVTLFGSKFRARITINYKQIYLGLFDSLEDAIIAYNEAAIKYHGEFAKLNQL